MIKWAKLYLHRFEGEKCYSSSKSVQ